MFFESLNICSFRKHLIKWVGRWHWTILDTFYRSELEQCGTQWKRILTFLKKYWNEYYKRLECKVYKKWGHLYFLLELQLLKMSKMVFSSIKDVFFTSCKMWNMFKVNLKGTRICRVNDKVKNKDTVDVVLTSLLLFLNKSHFLLVFLSLTLIS